MCRGGKDGVIRRCQLDDRQHASVNFRKKVKYRADKAGVSVEEWKAQNPVETENLVKETFPTPLVTSIVEFQDISEARVLPEGVPENIADHVKISKEHLDSTLDEMQKKALIGYTGFAAGVCNVVLRSEDGFPEHALYEDAPLWKEASLSPPTDFSTKEDLQDYMETMDTVLSERQETPRVLYRGHPIYESMREKLAAEIGEEWIDYEDHEMLLKALNSHYPEGSVIHYPSYVSTSLSAFQAADRTQEAGWGDNSKIRGVMFEMKTNAGLDITGASSHEYEREVVLPRDVSFRIESVHLQPQSYNTVSGFDDKYEPEERCGKNFDNLAIVIQMVEVDNNGTDITHTEKHIPKPLDFT
jgi:hypothetical protein